MHALALVVVVVTVAGRVFGEGVEAEGERLRDRPVEIDRRAPAAIAVHAGVDGIRAAIETRSLRPRRGDAARAAVAKEHAVRAARELVALGVVGIALDVPQEIVS